MANRVHLAQFPTPLHPLTRLSREVGADLWIKRDDLSGFGFGGNKVRKAEFLLADALAQGADVVLTAGAAQSNHCRAIAAACASLSIECRLFLTGPEPPAATGNVFLDRLAGASIEWVARSKDRIPRMEEAAKDLQAEGRAPYVIPIGGSNAVGARGYMEGFREVVQQLAALELVPAALVFATSSGGTYAGLLAGKAMDMSEMDLIGIRADLDPDPETPILEVARELVLEEGGDVDRVPAPRLLDEFVGPGYGIPTPECLRAQERLWRSEGILLDPAYSAKAFAGFLALCERGEFAGKRAIFLHTGGEPGALS